MPIAELDYWYDGQQRRFLEQVVRAFSGFQFQTGRRGDNGPAIKMVPCRMGSHNRMVSHIMRKNSENIVLTVPLITVSQTGLVPRREDLQHPAHVDTKQVHERKVDSVTGEYTGESGNRYSVKRIMPRPFNMQIQVDVWTSNMDQKHQLLEQILAVFMPDIQIQNSDNPLDWSAKTTLELEDVAFSSRTIPVGTEEEIDVATLTFRLPMWLQPPAEVKRQRIINQVVTNMFEGTSEDEIPGGQPMARHIETPGNHQVRVDTSAGTLQLLGPGGTEFDPDGNLYRWDNLLKQYGNINPTVSEVWVKRDDDIEADDHIVGTIQHDNANPNLLFWQIDVDTLPVNTLDPVNAFIHPSRHLPGKELPAVADGQRYLLLSDLAGPSVAWGNITARENDIIEYSGGAWSVVFQANPQAGEQFVVSLESGHQVRWTGADWMLAVGGDYGPGYWRISL